MVVEPASGLRFAVADTATVIQPKAGGTLGKAAPGAIAALRAQGFAPYLLQETSAALVSAVEESDGTVITLGKMRSEERLPSDPELNGEVRAKGGINPSVTHRSTEFGDTGWQQFDVATGDGQSVHVVRALFVHEGDLWALTFAGPLKAASAAYELGRSTLESGS